MIALSIIAAVVIAAALFLRHSPLRCGPATGTAADQRGYTLRSLVLTAVGVVAVVTVVFIGVNGCAGEDSGENDAGIEAPSTTASTPSLTSAPTLPGEDPGETTNTEAPSATTSAPSLPGEGSAGSNANIEGICGPGEIFDPELQRRGLGSIAAYGGVKSSAIGCYQFCYIESNELHGFLNADPRHPERVIETPGTEPSERFPSGNRLNVWWLRHSHERTSQSTRHSANIDWLRDHEGERYTVLPVVGPRHANTNAVNFEADSPVESLEFELVDIGVREPYEIRVDPSNEFCVVWNTDTEEVVFRSTEIGFSPAAGPNGEVLCRPRREDVPRTGDCPVEPIEP